MLRFTFLTLFPAMFEGPFGHSIIKRAVDSSLVALKFVNIRDFATDKHKSVDDRPYGGGAGMVMRADILDRAIVHARSLYAEDSHVVLMDPIGKPYSQSDAQRLTHKNHIILVCGHYEGVDARVYELVDEVISLGDFIVTGGELPSMIVADSIIRLIPGALGHEEGTVDESFSLTSVSGEALLEYPQYTRPEVYKDMKVPEILLGGNHKVIKEWQIEQAKMRTQATRPDLLKKNK